MTENELTVLITICWIIFWVICITGMITVWQRGTKEIQKRKQSEEVSEIQLNQVTKNEKDEIIRTISFEDL